MNLTPDRQGYLGDLMTKTIPQLQELLERQEKLLSKRKFLQSLPDKGEKTRKFAEQLKKVIDLKLSSLHPSEDLLKPSVKTETTVKPRSHSADVTQLNNFCESETTDEQDLLTLEAVASRDEWNVRVRQKDDASQMTTEELSEEVNTDSSNGLIASLEEMSLGSKDGQHTEMSLLTNSYERVIKRAESNALNKVHKFMPNRPRQHEHDHVPESSDVPDARQKNTKKKDESAANPPCYKFQETKLISVEESVQLIAQQRARNEELVAEKAARKLAEQLTPKMDIYSPASIDMQYREVPSDGEDQDSDDDSVSQDD